MVQLVLWTPRAEKKIKLNQLLLIKKNKQKKTKRENNNFNVRTYASLWNVSAQQDVLAVLLAGDFHSLSGWHLSWEERFYYLRMRARVFFCYSNRIGLNENREYIH